MFLFKIPLYKKSSMKINLCFRETFQLNKQSSKPIHIIFYMYDKNDRISNTILKRKRFRLSI